MTPATKRSEESVARRPSLFTERWDEMERTFGRMLEDFWSRPRLGAVSEFWGGRPAAVDVYEEKNEVVVKAELPGLEKSELEVNLKDRTLTIRGEKKKEEEIKEDDYYRSERSYGFVTRTLELPREVETDKAKATFKNGVLEVRIPRAAKPANESRKIEVG